MKISTPTSTLLKLILVVNSLHGGSCTSLKTVTELSAKSSQSLELFEHIPTTYANFCEDRCEFELARKNQLIRQSDIQCDCALYATADKSTSQVRKALGAYFSGIGALSKGNLTTYDTKALNEALVEGKFGNLTIEKKTVTAYSALGKIVLRAFTDGYRRKKLQAVIGDANPAVQELTTVLAISMNNLSGELDFLKERQFALYNELLMDKQSGYDKNRLSTEYYQHLKIISQKQSQLTSFAKSVQALATGHQKLFENRSKLNAKEIKAVLGEYIAGMQDLITDFKKL